MTQSTLAAYSEKALLSMRVMDLPLDKEAVPFPKAIDRLFFKLKRRGIHWRPKIWASEEWFSPDGRAGFAFPFTLLDPKLVALEKRFIGFSEGSTEREFEKLIDHECAHALDNAFLTRKHPLRKEFFGDSELPYPKSYLPLPYSKNFVRHLPGNYAQAHPEEDWAETFAIWLSPKREWRARYANWPALKKLQACDLIMRELRGKAPRRVGRGEPLHFKNDDRTLKEYFLWRKKELGLNKRNFYARKAREIFTSCHGKQKALDIIAQNEVKLKKSIIKTTGVRSYEAGHMMKELKYECARKDYGLSKNKRESYKLVEQALISSAQSYINSGGRRIYM